MEGSGRSLL